MYLYYKDVLASTGLENRLSTLAADGADPFLSDAENRTALQVWV